MNAPLPNPFLTSELAQVRHVALLGEPRRVEPRSPGSLVSGARNDQASIPELAGAEMERAVPVRSRGIRTQEQDHASISSSCGGHESRVAAVPLEIPTQRSGESRDPLGDGSVKVGPHREDAAGVATGPQDSITDSARLSSLLSADELAGDPCDGDAGLFSDDVRIHNIMLALADELSDELRTINETILLREFGGKKHDRNSNRILRT